MPAECRKLNAVAYAAPPEAQGGKVVERLPSGVEVWQATSEEVPKSNIYCEIPYTSADGNWFVYWRQNPKSAGPNRLELMVMEFGSWRSEKLDDAKTMAGCAMTPDGHFYYVRGGDSSRRSGGPSWPSGNKLSWFTPWRARKHR